MKLRLILLAGLGVLAFALPSNGADRSGVFRGRYTVGFETMEFIPCGKDERWWVTGNLSGINAKLNPSSPRGTMQTLFVKAAGSITPPGRYGHLGRYQRKLTIERVMVARPTRPGDCK